MSTAAFSFDWYQATVRGAELGAIREAVRGTWDGANFEVMKRAPHGYAFAQRIRDGDDDVGFIWAGGMHDDPHVVFTSGSAVPGSKLLRSGFPEHIPTRLDVCRDHAAPGAYDVIQALMVEVARDRRVKIGTAGDHLLTFKGRSCMLGSAASVVRGTAYDKAEELRQKFAGRPDILATVPEELARLEFRCRPQTLEARRLAALAEPVDLIGGASWARELIAKLDGVELDVFPMASAWRPSDHGRAYAAMLLQYSATLKRIHLDSGSWDCAGLQIGHDLAKLDASRKRGR